LRANGNELVVYCSESRQPLNQAYRDSCAVDLQQLATALSAKWPGELQSFVVSDMTLSDQHDAVESVSFDGNYGGIDLFYIQAKVPLRWHTL